MCLMDFLDRYSLYTSLQHQQDFVAEWVLFFKAGENLSNVIIYTYIYVHVMIVCLCFGFLLEFAIKDPLCVNYQI
jgi:hypothetical protein